MSIRLIEITDGEPIKLRLTWFMGSQIPVYAILSHTWEQDEISFQEMTAISENSNHPAAKKLGYKKIVLTCQEAKRKGIKYAWVDTCCIDKTSSSELSEAINSMYQWYQKAKVCYAFLTDFRKDRDTLEATLPKCRWFTRGWCLQELIAPQNMDFFDADWKHIGSRAELKSLISEITLIDEKVLNGETPISSIPVARRMSWAAGRQTTREEDMAYCLLGIFDVNMPMLYGEGSKAFMRLQEEIIKTSNDLSIFAFLDESTGAAGSPSYCDLFATSPKDFIGCGKLVDMGANVHWNNAFALTNKGLYFRRANLQVSLQRGSYSMLLNCEPSEFKMARIHLRKVGPGLFARYDYRSTSKTNERGRSDPNEYNTELEEAYIIAKVTPSVQRQLEDAERYAIHVWSRDHDLSKALQIIQRSSSSDRWDSARMQFLTTGERLVLGYWKLFPSLAVPKSPSIKAESGKQAPSSHCFLVCGVEHIGNSSDPRAWVRLYSLEEWRSLEAKFGIITQSGNATSPLNTGDTSDRITLTKGLTKPMTITATMQRLEIEGKKPRLELELDFNQEAEDEKVVAPRDMSKPFVETAPKGTSATEATPVKVTPVEMIPLSMATTPDKSTPAQDKPETSHEKSTVTKQRKFFGGFSCLKMRPKPKTSHDPSA